MSNRHIIAFDAGGTAVKAALYDEHGAELAVAGKTMAPLHPAPGCLERDPAAMWAAICERLAQAPEKAGVAPSSIVAVGLTGYGNGLYLLDRSGAPVRNGILSPDLRAQAIVASWRASGLEDAVIPLTYQRLWPGKPAPLLAWLEAHEPEALARADHAMFCKDYLRFRLTGAIGLEVSELSSGGLADQGARRFAPEILDHFGLGRYARALGEGLEPLTDVRRGHPGGGRRDRARRRHAGLGRLRRRSGDGARPGRDRRKPDQRHRRHLGLESVGEPRSGQGRLDQRADARTATGRIYSTDAAPTSASTFEWFVDSVVAAADPSSRDHAALFKFCDALAARARGGDDAPYFLPYLNGRLDQPEARGGFVGMASWHGLPEMIGAIFEGVAFEHRWHIDRLLKGRTRPRAARFAGGAARSKPWLDIFAAAIDLPLELAAASELGALGAAIVAAVGVGLYPDLETAVAAMSHVRGRIEPDRARVETMARRRASYGELVEALKPTWAKL